MAEKMQRRPVTPPPMKPYTTPKCPIIREGMYEFTSKQSIMGSERVKFRDQPRKVLK